jgi:hypothetical protein
VFSPRFRDAVRRVTERGRSQRNARGRGEVLGHSGMMSIGLPTLPGSSRGGENDDAVLNAVGRDLDNVADDGPMRAHTPAEALCSVSAKTKAQFGQPTRRSKGS